MLDVRSTSISEAQSLLASRSISAVELVESVLRRLDQTEEHVHAYVRPMAESALAAAALADADHARGVPVGALHGIPFAVKDVLATHDAPTEAGSKVLKGFRPAKDADAVHALRQAGAILIGKTVTQEFACGQGIPPTRNAWSLQHDPGGSSMGSAVSVAVGSAFFSVGGDAAGSVRKPAALNGVAGLLPTFGAVSSGGMLAASPSLERIGFFGRSVADCRAVLAAMPIRGGCRWASPGMPSLARARLGVDSFFFGSDIEADVADRVATALEVLESLGATLVPVSISNLESSFAAALTIFLAEAAYQHRTWLSERSTLYGADTLRVLQLGCVIPSNYVEGARRAQRELRRTTLETFSVAKLDALVTPTLPVTAISIDQLSAARDIPRYNTFTVPWNLTGQPALSIPCGFSDSGLPIGLQLVGRMFRDEVILSIAEQYERATTWHASIPSPGRRAASPSTEATARSWP